MKRFKIGMGVLGACTALSFGAFAQTAQDPDPHNPNNDPAPQKAPAADSYGQRPENKTRVPEMTDPTTATLPGTQAQTSSTAAPAFAIDPREVQQVFGQDATVIDISTLSADEAKRLQQHLKDVGYYKGAIDGVAGPKTRSALNTLVRNQFALTQSLVDQGKMPSTLATSLGVMSSTGVMPTSGSDTYAAPQNQNPTGTPSNSTGNGSTGSGVKNNKARPNPSGQAPSVAPPPPADYPASPPVTNQTGSAR